ncbi:SAM-dependent methyltransferase [Streptomyces mutabilis]|uniref:Uncharacterized protein n=1 Tax=Streptomyces mutabilis TaxID=67332 RepID=A0A086N7V7_9ACTN|nr:SAM-dependent methyltransferase [Streptomyces mutabilis]KFG77225.1 hypothetical protein FM21_14600 [Streptomyces mutabilis]
MVLSSTAHRSPGRRLTRRDSRPGGPLFDGLELLPPGLVTATEWYGEGQEPPAPEESGIYAGVARIP